MRAAPGFGPRSSAVTVARVDWTYTAPGGLKWDTPAPTRVLNSRAPATQLLRGAWQTEVLLQRDLAAEADARDALWQSGLRPLPLDALQWRTPQAGQDHPHLWALPEETHYGDFWADQVPLLQAQNWSIVVWPGFAHQSVPIDAWRLLIDADTGQEQGRELTTPLGPGPSAITALHNPRRQGSWLLTLGVEIDGETLDLAPMLADLLKRDRRWLNARDIAAIDDDAIIRLRAPGGRRIEAPAAPLKAKAGSAY